MKLTLTYLKLAPLKRGIFLPVLISLALSGCAGVEPGGEPVSGDQGIVTPKIDSVQQQVDNLRAQSDFAGAAQIWLQQSSIAGLAIQQRDTLLLNAVDDLIKANLAEQAQATMTQVSLTTTARWVLTSAQLQTLLNRPSSVSSLLESLDTTTLDEQQLSLYLQLQADAFSKLEQHLQAVEALNQLDSLLLPAQRDSNHARLWAALNRLTQVALSNAYTASQPGPLRGWLELALLNLQARNIGGNVQLQEWRNRYPLHPATTNFLETLRSIITVQTQHPQKVALLLPLSGRIAEPARAVKDGFLAAYYADQAHKDNTSVRIYSVDNDNVESVYQQAVKDGAEFIVGPLNKDAVKKIAALPELPVTTLALNTIDIEEDNNQLYQFALLPEDEARQVAERVWLDGHSKGIMIYPDTNWGRRVLSAFRQHWTQLGGKLVAEQSYSLSSRDFSSPVKQMLNVDSSKNRHRNLRRMLGGKLDFIARRRQDIDFIFVAAYPQQARQIRPQLKFFNAGRLPVYATSHVYSGSNQPKRDRDMNGIIFGDMPWTLLQSKDKQLHKNIENLWQKRSRKLSRLYAFGIDAYNIIPHLPRLRQYPFERFAGRTGSLRIDAKQQLHRQLRWAQFRSGLPSLIKLENTALHSPEVPDVLPIDAQSIPTPPVPAVDNRGSIGSQPTAPP